MSPQTPDPRFPYQDLAQRRPPESFADEITTAEPPWPGPNPTEPHSAASARGEFPGAPKTEAFPPAGAPSTPQVRRRSPWLTFVFGLAAFLAVFGIWTALNQGPGPSAGVLPVLPPIAAEDPESQDPATASTSREPAEWQLISGTWLWQIQDIDMDATAWLADQYLLTKPGSSEKTVAVQVAVTNIGNTAADPSVGFYYTLADMEHSGPITYEEEYMQSSPEFLVDAGVVEPGKSALGWIVFTVPDHVNSGMLTVIDWQENTLQKTEFLIP